MTTTLAHPQDTPPAVAVPACAPTCAPASSPVLVQSDSFLTLHYRLAGPAGDVVNTFNDKPATLTIGSGELSPGIERHLIGLAEGTRTTLHLSAHDAFGERNPDMQQWVARKLLAQMGDPLEVYRAGDVVQFPTPNGQASFAGAVLQVKSDADGQAVLFDFNHPLAGQVVTMEVHVIGVL